MKLVYSSVFLGLFATSTFSAPPSCPRTKTTSPRYATANLGNNLDLWLSQSAPKTNTIHSPASIFNILSAAYFGTNAKSETRMELQSKFGFKDDCAADGEVDNYAQKLGDMTRTNALETFNSYIFHKKSLNPDFSSDLKKLNFKHEKYNDFTGKEKKLNSIVEKDTDGYIKDVFQPGSLDSMTELILMNTILFKGKWDEKYIKFKEYNTEKKSNWYIGTLRNPEEKKDKIYKESGPFEAEFMKAEKAKIQTFSANRTLYIRLKFQGEIGNPSFMTIAMPLAGSKQLPEEISFNSIPWEKMERKEATVYLPKFEIESNHNLVAFMKNHMGAKRLFSTSTAELDRMFENPRGEFVSKFFQKATIKVNEKGAEAAAATVMQIESRSGPRRQRVYDIKRPFKFFIHNLKKDTQLKKAKDDLESIKKSKRSSRDDIKLAELKATQDGDLFFSGVVYCPMNNC